MRVMGAVSPHVVVKPFLEGIHREFAVGCYLYDLKYQNNDQIFQSEWHNNGLFSLVSYNLLSVSSSNLYVLTLKVLVTTIDAQWEGMGDVGSARYESALLPPCPTIRVLSCSN